MLAHSLKRHILQLTNLFLMLLQHFPGRDFVQRQACYHFGLLQWLWVPWGLLLYYHQLTPHGQRTEGMNENIIMNFSIHFTWIPPACGVPTDIIRHNKNHQILSLFFSVQRLSDVKRSSFCINCKKVQRGLVCSCTSNAVDDLQLLCIAGFNLEVTVIQLIS